VDAEKLVREKWRLLKATMGLRLDPESEFNGADLSLHRISASPERETLW